MPLLWYVYRWGLGIHHLSGISNEQYSWEKSLDFEPYTNISGNIQIEPKFQHDYLNDIENFIKSKSKLDIKCWRNKIKDFTKNRKD